MAPTFIFYNNSFELWNWTSCGFADQFLKSVMKILLSTKMFPKRRIHRVFFPQSNKQFNVFCVSASVILHLFYSFYWTWELNLFSWSAFILRVRFSNFICASKKVRHGQTNNNGVEKLKSWIELLMWSVICYFLNC